MIPVVKCGSWNPDQITQISDYEVRISVRYLRQEAIYLFSDEKIQYLWSLSRFQINDWKFYYLALTESGKLRRYRRLITDDDWTVETLFEIALQVMILPGNRHPLALALDRDGQIWNLEEGRIHTDYPIRQLFLRISLQALLASGYLATYDQEEAEFLISSKKDITPIIQGISRYSTLVSLDAVGRVKINGKYKDSDTPPIQLLRIHDDRIQGITSQGEVIDLA